MVADSEQRSKAPKLSLSQRVLASLPQFRRDPASSTPQSSGNKGSSGSNGSTGASFPKARDAGSSTAHETSQTDSSAKTPTPGPAPSPLSKAEEPATLGQKLSKAFLKPAPEKQSGSQEAKRDPALDLSNAELEVRIKRIDDKERKYALIAAGLGAALTVLLTVVALEQNPAPHHKNYASPGTILLEGGVRLLLAGLVVVTAYTRRRSFVGFGLLFLGVTLGFPLALLFFGLGGWLIWRVFKYQRILTSRGVNLRSPRSPPEKRDGSRTTRDASARARTVAERRRAKRLPEPKGPSASKRYTPPKPTRPRPPKPE